MKIWSGAALAALIVVASSGLALAEPAGAEIRIVAPRQAASNAQALAVLHADLTRASQRACDVLMKEYVNNRRDMRRCVSQTLDAAIARADQPVLDEVHAALPRTVRYRRLDEGARLSAAQQALQGRRPD